MALSLVVFLAQVDGLLSASNDELSQLRRYRLIKSAVERYSGDAPDTIAEDEVGDGGKYYAISGLASWVEGFSRVAAIEYPAQAVSSDAIPQYLEPEDWRDNYWASNVRYLFLPNHSPSATETMRITYTVPYEWTASSITTAVAQTAHGLSVNDYAYQDTSWQKATDARIATHRVTAVADADNFTAALLEADIPTADFFAVCNLAAGLCCEAISTKFSRTNDATIAADSVHHISRAGEFARRAKEYIAMYDRHMGLGEKTPVQGTGDFVDWDTSPGWRPGRQFIFHGKGTR